MVYDAMSHPKFTVFDSNIAICAEEKNQFLVGGYENHFLSAIPRIKDLFHLAIILMRM